MVEKPDPEDAPSNYAAIGRYILQPAVMDELRKFKRGAGGDVITSYSIHYTKLYDHDLPQVE